ncbi:MAG: HEAT repeat domain-containing protein [Nitrospira sp.]|nr:HEAT repeat domain-containing protein [Nitrospira sp.]
MDDPVAQQIAALADHDWTVRQDAAVRLGRLKDPRAVEPLVATLRDPDRSVREAVVEALQAIGAPSVMALSACLSSADFSVQEAASQILASIADAHALEPLVLALRSQNWIVRMYAAKALGRLKDPRTVSPLLPLLQDSVNAVREEASAALAAIGDAAIPSLIEALTHRDWLVRLRAVESLGVVKSPKAVPPLIAVVFNDTDSAVREDAVRALGNIGDRRAVEPLVFVVKKEPNLRIPAVEALGRIGDRRAVPILIEVARGTIQPPATQTMTGCGDRWDPATPERAAAVHALGMIGDDSAIPTVAAALTSAATRTEAAEALTRFGANAIPWLLAILRDSQDDSVRHFANKILAAIGRLDRGGHETAKPSLRNSL